MYFILHFNAAVSQLNYDASLSDCFDLIFSWLQSKVLLEKLMPHD